MAFGGVLPGRAELDHPVAGGEQDRARGDEEDGGRQAPQALGDALFRHRVDGGGRFVQDDEVRVGVQRPCQQQPLALAAGEPAAVLPDLGQVAPDLFTYVVEHGRPGHGGVHRASPGDQVGVQGAGEDGAVVGRGDDPGAYPVGAQVDRVHPADQEFAAGEGDPVAEPVAEVPGMAGVVGDDADEFAGAQVERFAVAGRMPAERGRAGFGNGTGRQRLDQGRFADQSAEAARGGTLVDPVRCEGADMGESALEELGEPQHRDELADGDVPVQREIAGGRRQRREEHPRQQLAETAVRQDRPRGGHGTAP